MNNIVRRSACIALCTVLVLAVAVPSRPQGRQRPPEYNEIAAASEIAAAAARLKEFERIKGTYPSTRFMAVIDRYILNARVELAGTLDEVLALQQAFRSQQKGQGRVQGPFVAADQILTHAKLKTFDKAAVLAAVLNYRDQTLKAVDEPGALSALPPGQQQALKSYVVTGFEILVAQAYLNAGDSAKALAALEAYKKEGGPGDAAYYYTLGATYSLMGRAKPAYEAYLSAAADNHAQSLAAARELYVKLNGKPDGFDAALEAKTKELPYVPEPFQAPAGWQGRTVLAELFTGSECPPCVAADLGFDGLIESIPAKYLAVLEYHLPIPRPDPMINAATKARQEYYGIESTPTVVLDGGMDRSGGGPRGTSEGKYKQYKAAVEGRLAAAPEATLKVAATRAGDTVNVDIDAGRSVAGAAYFVVLVQAEEAYKGSNGLMFHKMVVRDMLTVEPGAARTAVFDLAASELKADQYLTDFETSNPRFQGFKFAERHHKIDRRRLRVVFFAQDATTKKVLNAAVADVK